MTMTVPASVVAMFARVASNPSDVPDLLRRLGLPVEAEPAALLGRSVGVEAYYDTLERAAGPDDHALGLRYGESVTAEDFGAYGLALKTALSVRGCLERLVRYSVVLSDSVRYELRPEASGATFILHGRPACRRGVRLANEGALSAVVSVLRQSVERPSSPTEVRFAHAAPEDVRAHRSFFHCPVRFGAAHDALHFDGATLEAPMRLGDPGLSAFLLAQLDEQLSAVERQGSLVTQVRRAVIDSLCEGPPSQAIVARRLGLSPRTLQRRLAEQGLSFRAVAERARREVAESLLARPQHSLAEVAYLAGFSEQSAFTRAFKRWSGKTPRAFREAAGA